MSKYDIIPPAFQQVIEQQQPDEIDNELIAQYGETPNIIDDTEAEMQVLRNAFKSPLDKEREKKEQNTNPNFWFAVYFQNENQKNEFLEKIKASHLTNGMYINGLELAKVLGIDIQKQDIKAPGKFKNFKQ